MFQYLLNPFPCEKDTKFQQSQGDRGLGISVCLGCHIIEPFSKMNVLTKQTKNMQVKSRKKLFFDLLILPWSDEYKFFSRSFQLLGPNKAAIAIRQIRDCYLSHAQSSLVHVAQVEHSLCTVLFFRGPPVVECCCFIINICSIPIVMVITNFNSCCRVAFGWNKKNILTGEKAALKL